MSEKEGKKIENKVYFEPSTVEGIDRSVYEYVKSLKLSARTNEGFKPVPILWGTSERSFLSKNDKDARDAQGMLRLPIMSVKRTGFTKSLNSRGIFQGNVPENPDEKGGSLMVSRVINQEKTNNFARVDAKKISGQEAHPVETNKIVYRTISSPMPVNVEMTYEILIRTEYQEQMNSLMLPFITNPGTINYIKLESSGHRYEGFIQEEYASSDNLSDYSSSERKFETKISLRVVGYLVGQGDNREKPHFSIRENFVEIKIPRESVVTDPKELEKYGL